MWNIKSDGEGTILPIVLEETGCAPFGDWNWIHWMIRMMSCNWTSIYSSKRRAHCRWWCWLSQKFPCSLMCLTLQRLLLWTKFCELRPASCPEVAAAVAVAGGLAAIQQSQQYYVLFITIFSQPHNFKCERSVPSRRHRHHRRGRKQLRLGYNTKNFCAHVQITRIVLIPIQWIAPYLYLVNLVWKTMEIFMPRCQSLRRLLKSRTSVQSFTVILFIPRRLQEQQHHRRAAF